MAALISTEELESSLIATEEIATEEIATEEIVATWEPESPLSKVDWVGSVETDLKKAHGVFKALLFKEAQANVAVVMAEAEVEIATKSHEALSKELKALHIEVMQSVNHSEGALVVALSGVAAVALLPDTETADVHLNLASLMSTYKTSLNERAEGIYKCATSTLASRRRLARAEKKSQMCKRHLVLLVGNRNEAESEMERIDKMLADKDKSGDMAVLAAQLDRVGHFLDDESAVKRLVFC